VNATQGITKLVSFGSVPAEIPPEFIADLKQRCDESGQVISDTTLKEGASVVITHGPFTDAVGRILSLDEKQRVWLLLDLMGQQSRLAVDRSAVQAV
jgi:transcriptional antiterminator RfaH